MVKNLPAMKETWIQSMGQKDPLEKGMATHSGILAWKIPWLEEPQQLMGSQRVRHDWVTNTSFNIDWNKHHQFSSVQSLSRVWLFATPWIAARQASLSITTNSRVHSDSHPSSRWCHPAISSSVIPFSSCPQSLPASESFPISQLFTWGCRSIGVSVLASVLPKNTQNWSPLEWTDWISLQSKGRSRVFSSTTVQKHQFFDTQLSSQSNSHIHTWPLEKP